MTRFRGDRVSQVPICWHLVRELASAASQHCSMGADAWKRALLFSVDYVPTESTLNLERRVHVNREFRGAISRGAVFLEIPACRLSSKLSS